MALKSSPSRLSLVDDDMHFKMSKKIAQLTKVIYTLNCRNEDSEERVQWIARGHGEEMKRLIAECEQRVSEANGRAQKAERGKQDFVAELEKRHRALVQEAKDGMAVKLAALSEAAQAKQASFAAALKDAREAAEVQLNEEVAALRRTNEESTANLVTEYNERYNAMLVEQLDARDRLERDLGEQWAAKEARLSADLDAARAQLGEQLGGATQALQASNAKSALLAKQLAVAAETAAELDLRAGQLAREKAELARRLDEQRSSLDATHSTASELERRAAALTDELAAARAGGDSAAADAAQLRRASEKLQAAATAAENARDAAETLRQRVEHEAAELRAERDALAAQLADLRARLDSHAASSAGKESEAARLAVDLEAARAAAQEAERRLAAEVATLESRNAAAARAAAEAAQAAREAELAAARGQHGAAVDDLARRLASAEEELHRRSEELSGDAQWMREGLQRELAESLAAQARLTADLGRLTEDQAALQAGLDASQAAREEQRAAAEAQAAGDAATIQQLQAELALVAQSGASELDEQRRALEDAEARRLSERDGLAATHEQRLRDLRERREGELAAKEAEHTVATGKAAQDHAAALRAAAAAAEKRIADLTEESRRSALALGTDAEGRLLALQRSAAATEAELRAELDTLARQLELTRLASQDEHEASTRAAARLADRVAQMAAAARQCELDAARELAAAREAAAAELAAAVSGLTARHAADVNVLNKAAADAAAGHEAAHERLWKEAQELLRREEERRRLALDACRGQLTKDSKDAIESINAMHAARAREAEAAAEAGAQVLRGQLDARAAELLAATRRAEATAADLQRLRDDAAVLRLQLEEERRRAQGERVVLLEGHAAAMGRLEADRALHLTQLLAVHRKAVDDLTAQLSGERVSHGAMTDDLKAAYDALLHKYQFRESRAEDVELINRLLKDNHDLEKSLEKAHNDMRLYKLELINREENYNKLFGRHPVLADAATAASPNGSSLPLIKVSRNQSTPTTAAARPHRCSKS